MQLQFGKQYWPDAKHSQYNFRHREFLQLHVFRSVWMLVIFVGIPGEIIFSSYSSYSFVLCFSLSCCSSSRVSPRGEVFRNLNFLFRLPSLLLSFSSSHSRLDLRDQPLLRESPSLSFFLSLSLFVGWGVSLARARVGASLKNNIIFSSRALL